MNCPTNQRDRNERTRVAILTAFRELLFAQGFASFSVGHLAQTAGVARSTFYEHFSGKDDVLRVSMAQFLSVIAACVSSEAIPDDLDRVLGHLWGNRRLTDAIFSGTPRTVIVSSMVDLIEVQLRGRSGGAPLVIPYRLASILIAEGQLALVESWLRGQHYSTPVVLSDVLYRSGRAAAGVFISQGEGAGE